MKLKELSPQQRRILRLMKDYHKEHGKYPTQTYMGLHFGVSQAAIHMQMKHMERKGWLTMFKGYDLHD